ncbi:MAG: methyltransferase domain-containing protein [Hyphomicrobiaceae bacterium]
MLALSLVVGEKAVRLAAHLRRPDDMTGNGWDQSADAYIASMGDRGDYTREFIVDPVMLGRIAGRGFRDALDVGCGEGRFCRIMREHGMTPVGIDPTARMLMRAKELDPSGDYRCAKAEALPFEDGRFDLVVTYMTLIDIPDIRRAIPEMSRVLRPGGTLLIANLTSFATAAKDGWVADEAGNPLHCHPVDHYLEERAQWAEWKGIRIQNWHRPLSTYMQLLLGAGLRLTFFDELAGIGGPVRLQATSRRRPWCLVMEWAKV